MDAEQVRQEIDTYLDERDLKLVNLPIHDAMERRTICLKLAIETKTWIFAKNDGVSDAADAVVAAAKLYEAYVSGAEVQS